MPKLVQINSVCNGSTGKIMGDIQRKANIEGFETLSIYARRKGFNDLRCIKVGGFVSFWSHVILTTLFDIQGHGSYFKTKKIVRILKSENPDIIHLHNIHGYYLNYSVLFKYLRKEFKGKIIWTLHDCWPFTGHCTYSSMVGCEKWKNQCFKCPNKTKYPVSWLLDSSFYEYRNKKKYFTGLNELTIVTPSEWLKGLVQSSFLQYPTRVINNGINLKLFRKVIDRDVSTKYHIPKDKKIILGATNIWEERKGLDDVLRLSRDISDDIIIVLVGLNDIQMQNLPNNIIGIKRTNNQKDLVKIYSLADVFINPTKEDNYPTVNMEAIACGTPVITYDVGGCKEQIFENTGFVVNNYKEMLERVNYCIGTDYKGTSFSNSKCLENFDADKKYKQYIDLYLDG